MAPPCSVMRKIYLVTKNHSFSDGNKRIAATLFLWFLNEPGSKTGILLGTKKGRLNACLFLYSEPGPNRPFFFRHSEHGGLRPLSLAYSLRPNPFSHGLRADGTDGAAFVTVRGFSHRRIAAEPDSVCVVPTAHNESVAIIT